MIDRITFLALPIEKKNYIAKKICETTPFEYKALDKYSNLIFRLFNTKIDFVLVFSSNFNMGLSDHDLERATKLCAPPPLNIDEMKPVMKVSTQPILMSIRPTTWRDINNVVVGKHDLDNIAYVNREIAVDYCKKYSCRLPLEKEWENVARTGKSLTFIFGNKIPQKSQLDRWMNTNFKNLESNVSNEFGVYGLCMGEWCKDEFYYSYNEGEVQKSGFVVRGGGAFFWPWQDEEWVWCMSAMRMPSTDLIDGEISFRLVYDLASIEIN